MAACALTNPCRVEICALKHYVLCCVVCARTLASENACDTHGLLGVADAQVVLAECVLLAVECDELSALGLCANYYLRALNHVGIEAVHRLAVCHHHVVGDVDDVVDRTQTDYLQLVLKPFGTLLNLTSADAHTCVALASLGVFNLNIDGQVVVVDCKLRAVGTVEQCGVAVALEPSVQVACHTPVAECVRSVGCDVNLDNPVALQVIIFGCGLAYGCVLGQYDDAVVACANAYFVLGANHAKALNAAQLRLFDNEFLVAVVEHAAQVGNDNLLSGSHVGRTANNLLRLCFAKINGCYVQVV